MSIFEELRAAPRGELERVAQRRSVFREVNECIKDVHEAFGHAVPIAQWVCECANEDCMDLLGLSADEYDLICSDDDQFIVAPSEEHVFPTLDRVSQRHDHYWVVVPVGAEIDAVDELAQQTPPHAIGAFATARLADSRG